MKISWTSSRAYFDVMEKLPAVRKEVLRQLVFYWDTRHHAPTARELTVFCGLDGTWKRLSELENASAVHRSERRKCTITGRLAETWLPGPRKEPKAGELF